MAELSLQPQNRFLIHLSSSGTLQGFSSLELVLSLKYAQFPSVAQDTRLACVKEEICIGYIEGRENHLF